MQAHTAIEREHLMPLLLMMMLAPGHGPHVLAAAVQLLLLLLLLRPQPTATLQKRVAVKTLEGHMHAGPSQAHPRRTC